MNAYSLAQLLLRNALLYCDTAVLTRALDALTLTDTVLTVYDRLEKDNMPSSTASSSASSTDTLFSSSSGLFLSSGDNNVFNRDGLLMSEDSVLSSLTQYCIQEMKRREASYDSRGMDSASSTKKSLANKTSTVSKTSSSSDVENLTSVLQKFENHLIAIQILFRSWSQSSSKLHVSLILFSISSVLLLPFCWSLFALPFSVASSFVINIFMS
jgi:hypothetical protein